MAEIYKDSSEYVYLKIYQGGSLHNADSTPTVVVTDSEGTSLGAHTVQAVGTGIYRILITLADTDLEKTIYVDWSFVVDGTTTARRDVFEVITPYFSIKDAETMYASSKGWDWDAQTNEFGAALTNTQIQEVRVTARIAEQYARFLINGFCNQTFGLRRKIITAYGQQSDVLTFKDRLLQLYKVWENDELVIDNTTDPVVLETAWPLEITETKYGVRVDNDYDINEYEMIHVTTATGMFPQGWRYDVDALVGYYGVPEDVSLAARALINDFYCKDNSWQQKYINSISASDWRIVFDRMKYKGTGNFFVDRVLEPLVMQTLVVI
jgi:hypothetical protein